jgi:hypothetical protein
MGTTGWKRYNKNEGTMRKMRGSFGKTEVNGDTLMLDNSHKEKCPR